MYVRCNIVIDGIESTLEDVFASDCFLMKLKSVCDSSLRREPHRWCKF